jgi:hypothetical protein
MRRFITISALGLIAIAGMNAGQITGPIVPGQIIQVGSISTGANGVNAGVNQGLTVTQPTGTITDVITSGTGGNNSEKAYSTNLYVGATGVTYTGGSPDYFNATVGTTPQGESPNNATNQGLTAPNGVAFDMLDEGTANASANAWMSSSAANNTTSITVPVGIFGVTQAWTMLNDEWGINGMSAVTVTFNFGSSATSATPGASIAYTLVEGQTIRSAVDCTGSTATGSQTTQFFSTNTAGRTGCEALATSIGGTYNANTGSGTVSAFNVATGQYTGDTTTSTIEYNTSGLLYLDAQQYNFGSYSNDYLVNMVITDTSGASLTNINGSTAASSSRVALSALDVSTPEPSTYALLLSGIGLLAYMRRRRQAA